MIITLDVEELAVILHKSKQSIYMDRRRRPNSLSPRVKIPGSSKLLWLESTVEEWLEKRIEKRTGRPREYDNR